jgi:hypothetical protein
VVAILPACLLTLSPFSCCCFCRSLHPRLAADARHHGVHASPHVCVDGNQHGHPQAAGKQRAMSETAPVSIRLWFELAGGIQLGGVAQPRQAQIRPV